MQKAAVKNLTANVAVPLIALMNDRLIPVMKKGNTVQVMNSKNTFSIDQNNSLFMYNGNMYLEPKKFFCLLRRLILKNQNKNAWLCINNEHYLPLDQINADIITIGTNLNWFKYDSPIFPIYDKVQQINTTTEPIIHY